MIVDIHAHIWDRDWLPERWWEVLAAVTAERLGQPVEAILRERVPRFWDPDGSFTIKTMDAAGIDTTMIAVLDYSLAEGLGQAKTPVLEVNRLYGELARAYPGRYIYAAGVDPRRPNALEIFEQCVEEFGARALKLYPPAGFYPNDGFVYPLYEKCVEYGLPVQFHTGPIMAPLRSKFSMPEYFDDVAVDFPRLKIIATHTGHGLWQECIAILGSKPNVYFDISGWQHWMLHPQRFFEAFRLILDTVPERVMFGTDASGILLGNMPRWVAFLKDLPEAARKAGVEFTEDEIAGVLGGTAARLLRVDERGKRE